MMLLPGRPLLYNGQEVESPQHLGLFVRDSIAWGQPDTAASRAFYRRVLQIAATDSAFVSGALTKMETNAETDVIAYGRGGAIVVVNARNHAVSVVVKGLDVNGARDLLTGRAQKGDTLSLPAYGAVVLER
jgi:hypothetical protein